MWYWGRFFSEYFCFPCQFSFHGLLHIHLSPGADTTGQLVANTPGGLSLNPPHEIIKKKTQWSFRLSGIHFLLYSNYSFVKQWGKKDSVFQKVILQDLSVFKDGIVYEITAITWTYIDMFKYSYTSVNLVQKIRHPNSAMSVKSTSITCYSPHSM
jgi:hypothetical protein